MRSDRTVSRILVALTIAGLAGCSGSVVSPRPSLSTKAPASAPALASAPSASANPLAGRDAWLAVGRRGQAGVEVILASTAERLFELPVGVPTEKWSQQVTATSDGTRTTLTFLTVQPGFGGWKTDIDGVWQLPTVGLEPMPAGVSTNVAESPNKSTTVLVELVPGGKPGTTRFAVVRRDPLGGSTSGVIELKGSFDYDAISPDGSSLYVVEHLGAAPDHRYQVRVVDVATGVLKDTIIADKRNLDEAMAGWPIAQLVRPDGMVFTLYRGAEHPFIHALNTIEAWAVCIDLPANGADDAMAALDWGLAASPDGHAIFAANATLGLAVDVDPRELAVRRSAQLDPVAAASIVLAKFGHQELGTAGRRVVVSADGQTIYAAGSTGILVVDAARLTKAQGFLQGTAVAGLGLAPDGRTLFALEAGSGRIVALDAASGTVLAAVPGDGFDRLLAVTPW
jgi:hypothetical protein